MEMDISVKRKSIQIDDKLKIIDLIENGEKQTSVAENFGLKPSTVSKIFKEKEKWKALGLHDKSRSIKKYRPCKNQMVESAVLKFLNQARDRKISVSGPIVQAKAKDYAGALGIDNFKASTGWLSAFKKRNGIQYRNICGESGAANMETAENFKKNSLPEMCKNYVSENIYNFDETDLFFKMMPNKSLVFRGETCSGGTMKKDRITVALGCNMTSSHKLPVLVIGRSKNPRCFAKRKVKSLPVIYRANASAWMTTDIFEEYFLTLDKKFQKENRNVLIFMDNCSGHSKELQKKLKFTTIAFFPPSLTCVLQPLDLGIIRAFKAHYRRFFVLSMAHFIDQNKKPEEIDMFQAIEMVARAWTNEVKEITIKNCFKKAGFRFEISEPISDLEENTVNDEQSVVENFPAWEAVSRHNNFSTNFESFVHFDDNLFVSGIISDEQIIEDVQMEQNTSDEDLNSSEIEIEEPRNDQPTRGDVQKALDVCYRGLLCEKNIPIELFGAIMKLQGIYYNFSD